MINEILLIGVGIAGAYMLFRIIKRQLREGKCAGCEFKGKCSK